MKLISKLFKFTIILIIVSAVTGGAFWMVYIAKWPVWSGVSLILGAIGLVIGWWWIRRLLVRRNEKAFVKKVVEQETPLIDVTAQKNKEQIQSLERKWAEGLNTLKNSNLARKGNPVYALPWFMMLGTTESGKSSALRSARLSTPFPETPHPAGMGTSYCDWWFTEHAVMLDTSGKYADPHPDPANLDEWQRLLSLLLAARKKEPLNGIVVTVDVPGLFEKNADLLEEEGRVIRLRIDELMRVLGARIPVYLLVTKCDQVYGMVSALEQSQDSFLRQPMGVINEDLTRPWNDFLEITFSSITERLKDLRLLQLDSTKGNKTALMLLPEEFNKLKEGLGHFMQGLCRVNPYQESLLLRGLYFCSALQSGSPISRFIKQVSLNASSRQSTAFLPAPSVDNRVSTDLQQPQQENGILFMDILPGTHRGIFLFDFFDWVLPADRWLYMPHREMLRRVKITWSLGTIAWLIILAGIFGAVSSSYLLNRHSINIFTENFKEPVKLNNDLLHDLVVLDRMRQAIVQMEDSNRRWGFLRLGLDQSKDAVKQLKKQYCALSHDFLEKDINHKIIEKIRIFEPKTPGFERGAYIQTTLDRLQYIEARLDKKGVEDFKKMPPPSSVFLMLLDCRMSPEMGERYQSVLTYYYLWQDDVAMLESEKQRWTVQLNKALQGGSGGSYDFNWLMEWINKTSENEKITIDSFWVGTGKLDQISMIEPCFTVKGKQILDSFIERIQKVTANSSLIKSGIKQFLFDYTQHYIGAWEQFADDFPEGIYSFSSIPEMRSQAADISATKIPSEIFIQRLTTELKPFADNKDIPNWLKMAFEYQKLYDQAHQQALLKQASGFNKAISEVFNKGKKAVEELKSKAPKESTGFTATERIELIQNYASYKKALEELAKGVTSRNAATKLAVEIYSGTTTSSQPSSPTGKDAAVVPQASRFVTATDSLKAFENQSRQLSNNPIFWDILKSPLDFFVLLASREASCSLQADWESQVLAESSLATEKNIHELLFGQQGLVLKFIKGPAAPFLKPTPQGFQTNSVMGHHINFNAQFINFIDRGSAGLQKLQDSYSVRITALPLDVNRETFPKPHAAILRLSCGDTQQTITNMNFPVQKNFKWSPKNCGEVSLQIKIGSLVLERNYPGSRGMINFLNEFRHGFHEFKPEDFPEQQQDLESMKLQHLRLKYNFHGHQALTSMPEYAPLNAPPIITNCWKGGQDDSR